MKKVQKSEYDIQAEQFAEKHNLTMAATYTGHRSRFGDHITAVYSVTLSRPGRAPWTFDFSTSINDSYTYAENRPGHKKKTAGIPPTYNIEKFMQHISENAPGAFLMGVGWSTGRYVVFQNRKAPSLYDILACLTKYNPGSFKSFCEEYGYSNDSISAKRTWEAVVEEWEQVERLFSDCMDELAEIS